VDTGCGDTESDWQNCGECGNRCLNLGQGCGTSCCVAGRCSPGFGPCFMHSSGFTTCDAACVSIGATCVAGACAGQYTWFGWGPDTSSNCPTASGPERTASAACDVTLPWTAADTTKRCCCAEP
jgi:hypothetical protein